MKKEWWKDFYDEHLAHMLLHPAEGDETLRTCDFLISKLALQPGDHVFDQCCGTGRIGLELAKRGYRVTGIDLAACYIQEAIAAQQPLSTFAVADAFEFVPATPCHAALNWWTSFGYAAEDAQNCQMLARAYDALLPGGRFLMDYMNVPNIYRLFQPLVTTRREVNGQTTTLHRHSKIDLTEGRLHKDWLYELPDGNEVRHQTVTHLYSPHQLARFFAAAGFEQIELIGDLDGSPLTLESPRCLVYGRKPTAD